MSNRILTLEKTTKQYEVEYNSKADELDEAMLMLEQKAKAMENFEQQYASLQNELKLFKSKTADL